MIESPLIVSTPPHVKTAKTTRGIMIDVIIALLPCAIMAIVYFGWRALMIELVAVFSCVATEFVYYFIFNKGFSDKMRDARNVARRWLRQFDFSSIVTAIILAMVLSSATEWYEVVIGSIFAIALVKMAFGGTGKNLVSPSTAARVFMFLSFAATMNMYVAPQIGPIMLESEIYSGATNLSGNLLANGVSEMHILDLFLGTGVAGCIGETCKAALVLGYVYLVVRRVIKWWQPVLFLVVTGFFSVLLAGFYFDEYVFDISLFLPYILSGGTVFAAVFMITDYVTSPKCVYGQIVYLIGAAVLLSVLRYAKQIEVVSFVVMIMNLTVPLIDRYIIPKPFGYERKKKVKEN